MHTLRKIAVSIALFAGIQAQSQIITTEPAFPTQYDTITVYYNAAEGNGELENVVPVYAHAGVITSNSIDESDWQHVVGDWGTNDPEVLMTPLGNNMHKIVIDVQNFYNIDEGEEVYDLAFVFRNGNGSLVGRAEDGSDIYVPLYQEGNAASILTPAFPDLYTDDESINIYAQSSDTAQLSLFVDDNELVTLADTTQVSFSINTADYTTGTHWIYLYADFGDETVVDSIYFGIMEDASIVPLPPGTKEGVNVVSVEEGIVTFNLVAPGKGNIYLLGDFNDYQFDNDYVLNIDPDGESHWLTLSGLDPYTEYGYQYYSVDDNYIVADPYCEKVLDPWNDNYISDQTYPNLKPYPSDKTVGMVAVFQMVQDEYEWSDQEYERPDKTNLIVYELLVRDFLEAHDYSTLMDTLDYLERLGINAIELMPVNEFEGNNSWGYNPSFFFAPDKYYGPKNTYKAFIDECHSRGIAVIMDIALNHSFALNPQVQLYFDPNAGQWGQPTADSPWFNEVPKHDFNVGFDYNHESPYTHKFMDSVLMHWVTEYHVDGYRLDLSKGFTQNNTLGDVAAWGQYDQSRIDILTNYANHIHSYDETAYVILEHFADNDEETVLANSGFMIWGNLNHEYLEASMGYPSNLTWGSYAARGWDNPHLVTYMESHDEERMMFKNLTYGNSQDGYDVTEFSTALERSALAATLFIPIPGPKMIWQFGEVGYDYSINTCEDGTIDPGCRLSPKPIRWDFYTDWQRKKLFDVYAELIRVKKHYPVFSTTDFEIFTGNYKKIIYLNSPEMNAVVLGNFYMTSTTVEVDFNHGGYWYELFTGDSLLVGESAPEMLDMEAGEYRLYTDVRIGDGIVTDVLSRDNQTQMEVYPNPSNSFFELILPPYFKEGTVKIYSAEGRLVFADEINNSHPIWTWNPSNEIEPGLYFLNLHTPKNTYSTKLIFTKNE